MIRYFFIFLFLISSFNLMATSPKGVYLSGQTTLNCQGKVQLCESCKQKAFNFISMQSATIDGNQLVNEKHSFKFNGFLNEKSSFELVRYNQKHVIYQNAKYLIAAPFLDNKDGFWVKKKPTSHLLLGPNEKPESEWKQLCNK